MGIAERLAPTFLQRALDEPGARRVPNANIDDLKREGLLRIIQARRNGGLEVDMVTQLDVVAAIAEGCASTAWVVGVAHAHSWLIS
ncbi:MAG: flavin-dependent monooxygenase, partial [Ilumatobacter sp.]|nr:flavin-dependent monooxygenase [Ilumatobacter sp.]